MRTFLASIVLALSAQSGVASDAVTASHGLWLAEGETNKSWRAVIALHLDRDELTGRIAKLLNTAGEEVEATCASCPGDLKGKPLKGMMFISGLRQRGPLWTAGRVINLEPGLFAGMSAACELEFKGNEVHFFGYKGVRALGKTVVWKQYAQ